MNRPQRLWETVPAPLIRSFVISSIVCSGMVLYRVFTTRSLAYTWLVVPNLLLAWIPFLCALALRAPWRFERPRIVLIGLGGVWLLFLPNAPYIMTDMIHLYAAQSATSIYFDLALISLAAMAGLLLGFVSLFLVQGLVQGRFGPVLGWVFTGGIWFLCSIGIYLGRVPRWNSWDVIHSLGRILVDVQAVIHGGEPGQFVVGFTLFLQACYLIFYSCLTTNWKDLKV